MSLSVVASTSAKGATADVFEEKAATSTTSVMSCARADLRRHHKREQNGRVIRHIRLTTTPLTCRTCACLCSARASANDPMQGVQGRGHLRAPHQCQRSDSETVRLFIFFQWNVNKCSFNMVGKNVSKNPVQSLYGKTKTFQKIPYNHFCFDNLGISNDLVFLVDRKSVV